MLRLGTLLLLSLFCISSAQSRLQSFSFKRQLMGTRFSIVLYAYKKEDAEKAAELAFQRIEELNSIMSDYLADSELSLLTDKAGNGTFNSVSKDLFQLLKRSKKWSKISKGRFDVTIGPLTKLWRKAFRQQEFPDTDLIEKAKKLTNHKWLKISLFHNKIKLKKQGMRLDLGAIAKGYAVDEAMRILQENGIKRALIDGGGDILVSEAPPRKSGWLVKLSKPEGMITIVNQAVATSGDQYQYLEWENKRYSHIIDPQTGYGVQNQHTVSIITDNCADADALASICSLMSKEEIKSWKYLKKRKNVRVILD